ncbi:NADH:flavin oxidoreductase/NADH oxidase [Pontitalea aquivivens]|uniref:NADH:flavin oxidoreductase/NADH oxidase n=1 Tax=Pontitalea aquivivens TaxID=3388663 RepID=UPI003970CAB1
MSLLFSATQVGGVTLRNRVVVPPMCQYMATDGLPSPWHHMHYGNMAASGAGLVIVESTAVVAGGRISPACLGLYRDDQEAALRDMLDRIRSFSDCNFGIQLGHAGRKASCEPFDSYGYVPPDNGGWSPIGPSALRHSESWPLPKVMDKADIEAVVDSFVQAARRADRAGFALAEIHAAHGYLISSFLSPLANARTDAYGGPLENRMRLAVEVARAVRNIWPRSKALGLRLNGTDWKEGGITLDETVVVAAALRDVGVDYVCLSSGGNSRGQQLPALEPGYQSFLAEAVRRSTGMMTMAVGMVLTATQADELLQQGKADLVAVGRAALDDPRWALHAAQELGDEIAYPKPHWRAGAKVWPGYPLVHRKT